MSKMNLDNPAGAEKRAVRRDAAVKQLMDSTRQQRHDWIDANVTDLASARQFLKRLSDIVVVIARDRLKSLDG